MNELAIKQALSETRLATFEAATRVEPVLSNALALYAWNAQVASAKGYSPRRDLIQARESRVNQGKVIAELPFFFWQTMFTQRFDARLWGPHLRHVMPAMDASREVASLRRLIFDELEQVRKLRNRIAHHEPVFKRDLGADFQRICKLIAWRSPETATWLMQNQKVLTLLAERPPIHHQGRA